MASRTAYLAWSPGFGRALFFSAVAEVGLILLCVSTPTAREIAEEAVAVVQTALLDSAHALKWWSAIAVLASACCVVQVMLSALSLGCSGFNLLLGPLRPPLLVASMILQAASWWVVLVKKPDQMRLVAVSSVVTALLALSPELFELIVSIRRPCRSSVGAGGRRVVLKVLKMSCSVCATKVRDIAEALQSVESCEVDIDKSTATLTLVRGADVSASRMKIADALAAGGYPAEAASRATGAQSDYGYNSKHDVNVVGGVVGGLLGSSCCAVQLCLNWLASLGIGLTAGCAGFNIILGPARPYARMATATFLCVRWARARKGQRRQLLLASVLAVGLTYLPEALLYAGATALAPPSDGAMRVHVPVGGIGCEACQHAVARTLVGSSGVLDARVRGFGDEGSADLIVHPGWGFDSEQLATRLRDAGFEIDQETLRSAVKL